MKKLLLLLFIAGCEAAPAPTPSVSGGSGDAPARDSGIHAPGPRLPSPPVSAVDVSRPDQQTFRPRAAEREEEARRVLADLLHRQRPGPPTAATMVPAPSPSEVSKELSVDEANLDEARAALPAMQEAIERFIPQIMTSEQFQKALTNAVTENEKGRSP